MNSLILLTIENPAKNTPSALGIGFAGAKSTWVLCVVSSDKYYISVLNNSKVSSLPQSGDRF